MGLFDKIKDNARDLSMKAIESTREYDEDYVQSQQVVAPETDTPTVEDTPVETPAPTEPVSEEPAFIDEGQPAEAEKPAEEPAEPEEKKSARKSKVTEVSKADHEKAEKEKKQEKAKQAAKERLAKSYVPSYKKSDDTKDTADDKKKDESKNKKADKKPSPSKPIGIVDVAPGRFIDPTKKAIYARERAALNALASQRKLDGTVPLYVATHMNFRTRVFIDRIEYSGSFGKNVIKIDQVAWVKLRHGGTGVIIETVEGKRIVMVVKQADRLNFASAVLKVQSLQPKKGKFKDTKTVRIDELEKFGDGVDEIEKLAKLFDKGILSQEEFDAKKKQILGL